MTIVYNILARLILAFLGVILTVGVLIFGPDWFIKCIGATWDAWYYGEIDE
jgi:hypothetical protein